MGYSSLTYLRQFPVDVLKIDRTFIQDIQTLAQARVGVSLADAIIAMAKSLGLELIAEGVEYKRNQQRRAGQRRLQAHHGAVKEQQEVGEAVVLDAISHGSKAVGEADAQADRFVS